MTSGVKQIGAAAAIFAVAASGASAQSFAPMKLDVVTMTDEFIGKFVARNPYSVTKRISFVPRNMDGEIISGIWISPETADMAPGAHRRVIISAKLEEEDNREFYLCAEAIAGQKEGQKIRAQVCSHVKAQRVSFPSSQSE